MRWWHSLWQRELAEQQILIVGPVALDVVGRRVMIAGSIVHLPVREAVILEVLMRNAGRVVSTGVLCTVVGRRHDDGRCVARLVRRLARRLLVSPLHGPLVESVGNAGYRFLLIELPGAGEGIVPKSA